MVTPTGMDTIGLGAISVYVIQLLKKSKWAVWFNDHSVALNRIASLGLAALGTAGIHASYSKGTLTIAGITVMGILTAGWLLFKQFTVQELIFQVTKAANKTGNTTNVSAPQADSVTIKTQPATVAVNPKP